jgi:manganese transport protein
MLYAAVLTGVVTFVICYLKIRAKTVEIVITVLGGDQRRISGGNLPGQADWGQVVLHTLVPSLPGGEAVLIAVGMLGATVMPHGFICTPSWCSTAAGTPAKRANCTTCGWKKSILHIAMNIAFFVNAAMVIVSAAVFFRRGMTVDTMEQAPGPGAAAGAAVQRCVRIALLASGLSSSAVGTMAGQTILRGFVNVAIPTNVLRLVTMAPAVIIIAMGVNPMDALVLSQAALSFILPIPIIQMLKIAGKKDLMGTFANKLWVQGLGILIAAVIISLNVVLLYLTFTGQA